MSASFHFGIVCSEYNREYTDALLASTVERLEGHETEIVRVPGAFEIPLQVQRLAARPRKLDAVIALGLVWEGRTIHAQEIVRAVTDALMRIGLEQDTPIVHGVICVKLESEAKERTKGLKLNRGYEAAAAALAIAKLSKERAALFFSIADATV